MAEELDQNASLRDKRLGPYVLDRVLGRGGMGVVYRGRDRALQRTVAIKVLPSFIADDERLRKRFVREARACARLNHPNIVTMYGAAKEGQTLFIVMEYVEGQSLADLLKTEERLPVRRSFEIARAAAEALQAAHASGIIHRDIKPANIMIASDGRVKVMDFGLARVVSEETGLTSTGVSLGTPRYMSPEQWKDSKVDERSDIYSLGVTLYECLAGTTPFTATTPMALMRKVLDRPAPPIHAYYPEVPKRAAAIVARMIARDPRDRYQTVEAVLRAIDDYMVGRADSSAARDDFPLSDARDPHLDRKGAAREPQNEASENPRTDRETSEPSYPPAKDERSLGYAIHTRTLVGFAGLLGVIAAFAWYVFPGTSRFAPPLFPEENFVYIEPGTFMMGSPANEPGRENDELLHPVTLSSGFWLSRFEVTQAQWEAVMGYNPSGFRGSDHPVEQVSWEEVQNFIEKVNQQHGTRFRLPAEAEWEYACRAGRAYSYGFGNSASALGDYAWTMANSQNRTWPVGMKRANAWGLHDMHGNVWEWVQDWAGSYPAGEVTDPTGPAQGSRRIGRGGSWSVDTSKCRCADRSASAPSNRGPDLGFRLATD